MTVDASSSGGHEHPGPDGPPTILCVDDEPNILASLQRLFRKIDCQVLTAPGGEAALALLKCTQEAPGSPPRVAMVISDQRMPKMTGAELLGQVKKLAPDSIRILLTGYADVTSAIEVVNNGEVWRYLTKPWNDDDLVTTVKAGLAHYELVQQNRRLQEQTRRQNEELVALNQSLERRVAERTALLEKDLFESLAMLLRVMEVHSPRLVGHARRVAAHVQRLAPALGVPDQEAKAMVTAALLHDLGLIGIPHEILDKPEPLLNDAERALLRHHPQLGVESVSHLSVLKKNAPMILSHHERYDGQGYPKGAKGEDIPLGARIIAVVDGYDHAVAPFYGSPIAALEQPAQEVLRTERGLAFDPLVVDTFLDVLSITAEQGRVVQIADLQEGMVLAKNLSTLDDAALVMKGAVLTLSIIQRVKDLPKENRPLTAVVEPAP